jgi:hypothetical protein
MRYVGGWIIPFICQPVTDVLDGYQTKVIKTYKVYNVSGCYQSDGYGYVIYGLYDPNGNLIYKEIVYLNPLNGDTDSEIKSVSKILVDSTNYDIVNGLIVRK